MEIRPEIKEFTEQMEKTMQRHDREKSDSWKDVNWDNQEFIRKKFIEEIAEVLASHFKPSLRTDGRRKYRGELIDVANLCMMLHYHNR